MYLFKTNLQLFAEDEQGAKDAEVANLQPIGSTDIDDSVFDNSEQESEDEGEKDVDVAEPQDDDSDDISENKNENNSRNKDEDAKYAAARREAEKQSKLLKDRQDNFAKQYGYNSFEELEQAHQQQQYQEKGYDPEMAAKLVQVDKMMAEMQEQKNKTRIIEEKSKLQTQPFFKELETEIDEILEQNPALPVPMVFDLVKGKNIEKLLSKQGKAATQKALNNLNSKSHVKPDGKGTDVDTIFVDESEWNFYRKLNPKANKEDYVKFLKSEKRR